jgi:nucleotide-binding universal stress UspA family protein
VLRKQSDEPYQQVATAVDFSPQSAAAIKEARRLAPEAALQLIHAIGIPLTFKQAMLRASTPQIKVQKYRLARAGKARDDLSAFACAVVRMDKVATHILEGEPSPALVRFSKSRRIDLLAMCPHGRSVVYHALLGSVTLRVLKEAGCDVLIATQPQ